MFNARIVETVTLPNLLSGGMSYQFSRCFTRALMLGTLMLAGCATSRGPDKPAESNPGVVVSEAQAGETTPKATEESGTSPGACAVVGAIIGGAIGVAVLGPICANEFTVGACPEAILAIALTAAMGGVAGAHICSERVH